MHVLLGHSTSTNGLYPQENSSDAHAKFECKRELVILERRDDIFPFRLIVKNTKDFVNFQCNEFIHCRLSWFRDRTVSKMPNVCHRILLFAPNHEVMTLSEANVPQTVLSPFLLYSIYYKDFYLPIQLEFRETIDHILVELVKIFPHIIYIEAQKFL